MLGQIITVERNQPGIDPGSPVVDSPRNAPRPVGETHVRRSKLSSSEENAFGQDDLHERIDGWWVPVKDNGGGILVTIVVKDGRASRTSVSIAGRILAFVFEP